MMQRQPKFTVSLMCMDMLRVEEQVTTLNRLADGFHLDIMDGHFAPNLALSPDWIRAIQGISEVPLEAHVMATDPHLWIEPLADAGVGTISVHAETINRDAFRTFQEIRARGAKVGIVLNPATLLSSIEYYLDRVDLVTVMTVDVGFAGQPFIEEMLEKIAALSQMKRNRGLDCEIQIDGSCNEKTFQRLHAAGAESYILGSSGLFSLDDDLATAWATMRQQFEEQTGVPL